MPTTPNPLIWDTKMELDGAPGLGGVVHYYDNTAQTWLLLGTGELMTITYKVEQGDWKSYSVQGSRTIGPSYQTLRLDHPYNGTLFGVATLGSALVYLRYNYSMDCSEVLASGTLSSSVDSPITQLKANLINLGEDLFIGDATFFQPGSVMTLQLKAGSESPWPMCRVYLDSVQYDRKSSTIPLSGQNAMGFFFSESTFDEEVVLYRGGAASKFRAILVGYGKLPGDIIVEGGLEFEDDDGYEFEFRADQTLLSGLEQLLEVYTDWKVVELPDGTVIAGTQSFIESYQSNSYYTFEKDSIFKRKTRRLSTAAYTQVRVTGQDEEELELDPVIVKIDNYTHWSLPEHKTYHAVAPDTLITQEELEEYAENLAKTLQYAGVTEEITGSFQPHLLIGDIVAEETDSNKATTIGVVTSIKHKFGRSGYLTEFSTDSGGAVIESSTIDTVQVITPAPLRGYNRRQTLADMIRAIEGPI